MSKQRRYKLDDAVDVRGNNSSNERKERLKKRKLVLKAAIRSVFFGTVGALCFQRPGYLFFGGLFLLYVLLE